MAPFVARNSRWMVGAITVFCCGMIAICLSMIGLLGPLPEDERNRWVGWIFLPFMLVMMTQCVPRLIDRRVKLVIDADGFMWDDWSDARIPWSAVAAMLKGNDDGLFFEVKLADPALYPERRRLSRIARGAPFGRSPHILLTVSGMDRSDKDLLQALRTFAPAHLLGR